MDPGQIEYQICFNESQILLSKPQRWLLGSIIIGSWSTEGRSGAGDMQKSEQ